MKFSIIIPTFNRAATIGRAISSVLGQNMSEYEVIVVDDGSKDETREIVSRFSDPRVRYFYQENSGRCHARNVGARAARGTYILFLDSDDEACPDWLENFDRLCSDPKIAIACCGYIDRSDKNVGGAIVFPRDMGPMYMNRKCLFQPPGTFAIQRQLFEEVGGYEEGISFSENTELAMRLIQAMVTGSWEIVSTPAAGVIYHRAANRAAKTESDFQTLFHAASLILDRHGKRLKKLFPRGYANYCAIAAVNAARLGRLDTARHLLKSGIASYPFNTANYFRLGIATIPRLASIVWLRHRDPA